VPGRGLPRGPGSAGPHILKVHMEIATEARRNQSERALHHCLSE